MAKMSSVILGLLASLLSSAVAARLPYTPTIALPRPSADDDSIYLLRPSGNDTSSIELVSLNISTTISPLDPGMTTVTDALSFVAQNDSYTPVMDGQGNIHVYTGNCEDGADGSSLWSFATTGNDPDALWLKNPTTVHGIEDTAQVGGSYYLASGMAFSSTLNGSAELYVFGGMCPNSSILTVENWQSSANFSNTLISMQATSPSTSSSTAVFDISTISSRGPPIPEAGFTVTPLQPTYFNTSGGPTSQQQNFVLVGGHTQQAFINMSQVALFSLPEETWAFLPVDSPPADIKTDLAKRVNTGVDPRSGHTAVLTDDGKQIIVFGGWVGDLTTPADPQLVILELGAGYGGNGDWRWTVPPTATGSGIATGAGLYGHGAAMLPGGVMMLMGGYSIPSGSAGLLPRADSSSTPNVYFYNVTSNSWIAEYINPGLGTRHDLSPGTGDDNQSPLNKAGLGAGLGFGLAALIAVAVIYICSRRRARRQRLIHEKDLRALSLDPHVLRSSTLGVGGIDGRGGDHSAFSWMGQRSGNMYPWAPSGKLAPSDSIPGSRPSGSQAERTGLLVEIPSPTRGLRRSLYSRGSHLPPSWLDDGRRTYPSNHIHPIDERDEDEPMSAVDGSVGSLATPAMMQSAGTNIVSSAPVLDPFRDRSPSRSRTPSPLSPAREREMEVQTWMEDWTAADILMQQQAGRLSPERQDRTSSSLSEGSYSSVSALSNHHSIGALSRSISQRSAALFTTNPFSANTSTAAPPPTSEPSAQSARTYGRSRSLALNSTPKRPNTPDTFKTAATSFPQLRAEGEALLGGPPASGESTSARPQGRRRGWVGSVRRAFMGGDRSISPPAERLDHSTASSPTRQDHTTAELPRRAASAGSMLWRKRQQGARDWDVEQSGEGRASTGQGSNAEMTDEGDWDVESAVERRVVQVMFTVPKEKLRIVNGGPEGDGESFVEAAGSGEGQEGRGQEKETEAV